MRWFSRPAATACARCIYHGRNRFFATEAARRPKSRFGPTVSLEHVGRTLPNRFFLYQYLRDYGLIIVVFTEGKGAESMETGSTRHETDR